MRQQYRRLCVVGSGVWGRWVRVVVVVGGLGVVVVRPWRWCRVVGAVLGLVGLLGAWVVLVLLVCYFWLWRGAPWSLTI